MTMSGRRGFLKGSLAALGGGALASAGAMGARATGVGSDIKIEDWNRDLGDAVVNNPYGLPSEFESHVVRRNVEWLTVTQESSVSFTPLHELEGFITPNGLCFERHHSGVATVDPAAHRLMINGLVDKPLIFTMEDLKRFPRVSRFAFLECAANSGMEWRGAQLNGCQFSHGMVHCVQYTGVSLKALLAEAGVKPSGKWLMPEGADSAGMNRSIPMEKALEDCIVAFAMNGEALRPEQGYPLRLVVPGWEGNMWVKWLRRIEVGDQPWHAREETSKYTDLLEDGTSRRFTWIMDAKSIVTNPSPQKPLLAKGHNLLSGLAWSGRGKVKRVDVTLDGGKNWRTAELAGPVFDKCMTRFYLPFEWNGDPMLIQSRCIDETGYIQPTKDELRKVRGLNSIYHNNGIQTWHVQSNGEAENVEIS
jgi:sulfane dehydrogenase subunit SoxC